MIKSYSLLLNVILWSLEERLIYCFYQRVIHISFTIGCNQMKWMHYMHIWLYLLADKSYKLFRHNLFYSILMI